jgi:hypothetical protein
MFETIVKLCFNVGGLRDFWFCVLLGGVERRHMPLYSEGEYRSDA